jgi:hypothetical protein
LSTEKIRNSFFKNDYGFSILWFLALIIGMSFVVY